MRTLMKVFIFLLAISLFPTISFTGDLDKQIDKACLRHAVSLVSKLKAEVIGELSQEKSTQAPKLATDSCQAYFKKEFSQNQESIAAVSNDEKASNDDGSVTDCLTGKVLSANVKRKKGNERLKNLKH